MSNYGIFSFIVMLLLFILLTVIRLGNIFIQSLLRLWWSYQFQNHQPYNELVVLDVRAQESVIDYTVRMLLIHYSCI